MRIRTSPRRGFLGVCLCTTLVTWAQNEDDALRLAYTQPGGTARSASLAGAFGALGADPGCISLNPAGFGLYTASEFSITPSFEVNDASSTYYGTKAADTQQLFYFSNLALVLNMPAERTSDWRSNTFGIVYDRLASYHWNHQAIGENVNSTMLQYFANAASGTAPEDLYDALPYTSGLAWETYAIDQLDTTQFTYAPAIPGDGPVQQEHSTNSEGATNNTSFFFAANYDDRLYIGASLGIVGYRFTRTVTHHETALDEGTELESFTYKEDLTTKGNGVDLKIGVLVRAADRLRLGLAFHSPMWTVLNDAYANTMSTRFRNGDGYAFDSPDGVFSYKVNTPWAVLLSAAYVAGQHGALSIDYELKDYRATRFRQADELADPYDFSLENAVLKNSTVFSQSVRVGTEWRAGPWYFRGGWGFWPNPYNKTEARHGLPLTRYSAGIGYRTDHVSVDLGLGYDQSTTNTYAYDAALVDPISEELVTYRTLLTLAYRP